MQHIEKLIEVVNSIKVMRDPSQMHSTNYNVAVGKLGGEQKYVAFIAHSSYVSDILDVLNSDLQYIYTKGPVMADWYPHGVGIDMFSALADLDRRCYVLTSTILREEKFGYNYPFNWLFSTPDIEVGLERFRECTNHGRKEFVPVTFNHIVNGQATKAVTDIFRPY